MQLLNLIIYETNYMNKNYDSENKEMKRPILYPGQHLIRVH